MKNLIKFSSFLKRNHSILNAVSTRCLSSNGEKIQKRNFNLINDKLKPSQEGVSFITIEDKKFIFQFLNLFLISSKF